MAACPCVKNTRMSDVSFPDSLSPSQDTEQLKRLRGFLQANKDLGERFSTELQAFDSLEVRGEEED